MADTTHVEIRQSQNGEAGFMLLAVVVMVFLVLLALAVAAPVVARDLRRDKEVESEHRAQQYVRAIRLYQRNCKCTGYPGSMDALEKTTNVRFLRHKYIDPLTGKSDWRLIHQPQTKTHFPFGEELTGLGGGGATGGGLGSASGLASGLGSPAAGGQQPVSGLAAGFAGASSGGASGASGGSTGAAGTSGTAGTDNGKTPSAGSDSGTGMFGDSSGGVIYGVGTSRSGDSILNPNQQTTYETWEFWYDPLIEQFYKLANVTGGGGLGAGGGGVGSTDASKFGQDAGSFGNNTNGNGGTNSNGSTTANPNSPTSAAGAFGH